jgi:hypothetical protein
MFEKLFNALGYGKSITPESALDLIAASERKTVGWVRTLDRESRFLGFRFYCPGKFINTTRPAMLGERDIAGNPQVDEVPMMQRIGCSFVTGEILPLQTLADVRVRCGQCGTESHLLTWMKENRIPTFDNIPTESRVPARSQRQIIEIGA